MPAHGLRHVRTQHLERHVPIVLQVARQVDLCHATLAQLAPHRVATLEGGVQACDGIRHRVGATSVIRRGEFVPGEGWSRGGHRPGQLASIG